MEDHGLLTIRCLYDISKFLGKMDCCIIIIYNFSHILLLIKFNDV